MLDFGIVGRLDAETRRRLLRLLAALGRPDLDAVVDAILLIAEPAADVDRHELRRDVDELIDSYAGTSLGDLRFVHVIRRVLDAMSRHRLTFSADLMLLIKALATIEGVGRQLDPDFQMLAHAAPFAERMVLSQFSVPALADRSFEAGRELAGALRSLPSDIAEVLRTARTDRLQIQFVHRNLDYFVREMDRSSNRLSFAIVIAALLIGSALLIVSASSSGTLAYPALGIAGFVAALVLGAGLIVGVLRSGRL